MEKRGQISLFVLFGLILLVAFGFISYLNSLQTVPEKEKKKAIELPNYALPLNNYIQGCVQQTAEDAVQLIGLQGGYFKPAHYLDNFFYITSYLYYNGESYMLSKDEMEKEISSYLMQNIGKCANLSVFREQGYEIDASEPSAETILTNSSVAVNIYYPVSIGYLGSRIKISDFTASIPVRLGYIRDVVEEIVNETVIEPDWVSVNTLTKHDLSITIKPRHPALVYFVRDDKSALDENENYLFIFATKYDMPIT